MAVGTSSCGILGLNDEFFEGLPHISMTYRKLQKRNLYLSSYYINLRFFFLNLNFD